MCSNLFLFIFMLKKSISIKISNNNKRVKRNSCVCQLDEAMSLNSSNEKRSLINNNMFKNDKKTLLHNLNEAVLISELYYKKNDEFFSSLNSNSPIETSGKGEHLKTNQGKGFKDNYRSES